MPDAPDTLPEVQTVYLDHAATTPMLPAALEAMTTHLRDVGNPSSLHASGRAARRLVEEAGETLAAALGARPSEVLFTGGGTESDNLAVKGLFWSRHDADLSRVRILASSIERVSRSEVITMAGWDLRAPGPATAPEPRRTAAPGPGSWRGGRVRAG